MSVDKGKEGGFCEEGGRLSEGSAELICMSRLLMSFSRLLRLWLFWQRPGEVAAGSHRPWGRRGRDHR